MLAAKFLDRHLSTRQYASLAIILSGVVISMLPDLLTHGEKTHVNSTPTTGRSSTRIALARVALAAVAQFLNAAQTVVEESILSRYSIRPAKIAGIEGVFGFCTMAALLVPLYYLAGARQHGGILDTPLAITQLTSSVRLSVAMAVCILGQALSYYYSLSLVKHLGATSRITIDLCKTVMVWSISLGLGWETFSYVRVLGFAVLVAGNLAYNG
ncbi:hypothetical protein EC988_005956 [Linderina pennispora]|nr:hypothetical protein EC988_005956 [Linderina pennispora]